MLIHIMNITMNNGKVKLGVHVRIYCITQCYMSHRAYKDHYNSYHTKPLYALSPMQRPALGDGKTSYKNI